MEGFMLSKMGYNFLVNLLGLVLILAGWYISILNVGLNCLQDDKLFTKWTIVGLILIIIGAYLPRVIKRTIVISRG